MASIFVVAVKDRAVDAFSRPFFVPSIAAATRSFVDEVNRAAPDNHMHAHPEDFDLYNLGLFVEETGEFLADGPPVLVVRAQDMVKV